MPWSNKITRKEQRDKRKEKKERKKTWTKDRTGGHENADLKRSRDTHEANGTRNDSEDEDDDWDELAREERLAKKVKKGHVSQEAFDEEFALS